MVTLGDCQDAEIANVSRAAIASAVVCHAAFQLFFLNLPTNQATNSQTNPSYVFLFSFKFNQAISFKILYEEVLRGIHLATFSNRSLLSS